MAKRFAGGKIHRGIDTSYENIKESWTVKYDDKHLGQLKKQEVEMAIDLSEKEDRREMRKKARVRCTKETAISKSTTESRTVIRNNYEPLYSVSRDVQHEKDNNLELLISLEQQVDDTNMKISKLEEKTFGAPKRGSLKDRIHELRLVNLEKKVFGKAQIGNYEERLEKMKIFFENINI